MPNCKTIDKLSVLNDWANNGSGFSVSQSAQDYLRPVAAVAGSCGSSCGASGGKPEEEPKPAACGTSCGAGDQE